MAQPQEDRLDRSTMLAMVAMGLAVLIIANDFTALSVALPEMESDLNSDLTTVQWVINGYALVFGVLIVTGGRLADIYGRRNIFFIGAAIFATFSLLGGLAPDIALVLACRALMGVGGAMMWPAILGMTYAILPASKAGLAGGLILGAAGFGNAVGPMLGGFLTDVLSWRWIFLVNVPIAAFAVFVTWRVVHVTEAEVTERGIDYRGIACLSIGLVSLLLALDQGTEDGFTDPPILALFVLGGVLLAVFAFLEPRTGATALVPRDVMTNGQFVAASLTVLLMSAIFFAALLYLPQFMQHTDGLDYSPLKAGAGLLPMMGTFAAMSFASGPLYARLGPKRIVSIGAAFLAVGMFLLSRLDAGSSYGALVPGMVVLGLGVGIFYSSITTAGVTALDEARASLAGGIIYMCQIAGGAVGLGLNTALVATADTLAEGIRTAFLVDTALALVGLVVALLYVGGRAHPQRLQALRWHHRAHA
jgi:EmrB/QacA subfamily drug resistance transporter